MKETQKSARSTTAKSKTSPGFTAEKLVRDARVRQGRQDRLLLPAGAEVQDEVRDARLQRPGAPRRRRHVADRVRADGVDRRRRGKDRRAREEGGELSSRPVLGPRQPWPRNGC